LLNPQPGVSAPSPTVYWSLGNSVVELQKAICDFDGSTVAVVANNSLNQQYLYLFSYSEGNVVYLPESMTGVNSVTSIAVWTDYGSNTRQIVATSGTPQLQLMTFEMETGASIPSTGQDPAVNAGGVGDANSALPAGPVKFLDGYGSVLAASTATSANDATGDLTPGGVSLYNDAFTAPVCDYISTGLNTTTIGVAFFVAPDHHIPSRPTITPLGPPIRI
jgi:hypothetical protein